MILKQTIDLKLFCLICVLYFFFRVLIQYLHEWQSLHKILMLLPLLFANNFRFNSTFIIYFIEKKRVDISLKKNWISGFMLFICYLFSYSYINMLAELDTLFFCCCSAKYDFNSTFL